MRTARVKVTRVNVNVESRSTSTFTRAFQAFRLFFNTRVNFTYVRRKEKHLSVWESVVWVVLACVIMWSNPYKTETTLERCCVVFCFAVFFCEVCSVGLFFSSDKAFKGMSNPYICCNIRCRCCRQFGLELFLIYISVAFSPISLLFLKMKLPFARPDDETDRTSFRWLIDLGQGCLLSESKGRQMTECSDLLWNLIACGGLYTLVFCMCIQHRLCNIIAFVIWSHSCWYSRQHRYFGCLQCILDVL